MKFSPVIFALTILTVTGCKSQAQQNSNNVTIVGAMRNVMWKGELAGSIRLDTIANRMNLYGIGPVEYLSGEIVIVEGRSYKATVVSETSMKVEETFDIKAPFFGYANISKWTEHTLPDTVRTIPQIERYLDRITKTAPRPFMFRLSGVVERAKIHIVNLPKGSKVSSPADAHKGQVNYFVNNEASEIIGFFSTAHKAIFTHHDTFLHMHLITTDRTKMGHLDELLFKGGGVKLSLPAE